LIILRRALLGFDTRPNFSNGHEHAKWSPVLREFQAPLAAPLN